MFHRISDPAAPRCDKATIDRLTWSSKVIQTRCICCWMIIIVDIILRYYILVSLVFSIFTVTYVFCFFLLWWLLSLWFNLWLYWWWWWWWWGGWWWWLVFLLRLCHDDDTSSSCFLESMVWGWDANHPFGQSFIQKCRKNPWPPKTWIKHEWLEYYPLVI